MKIKKVKAKAKYNGNHIFSGQEIEGYYYYDEIKEKEYLFVNMKDNLENICWNGSVEIEKDSIENEIEEELNYEDLFLNSKCVECGNIGFEKGKGYINGNDEFTQDYICKKCGYEIS